MKCAEHLAVSPRQSLCSRAVSDPRSVRRRVAFDQRSKLVEFETLKEVRLLATLRDAVAQLEDHVAFSVPLLFQDQLTR